MDLNAPFSNVRNKDRDAFTRVLVLELLFRRILRWELRGRFGRSWHTKLDKYSDEIETRRRRERLLGPIEPTSSDLAFLGLPEVVELVFGDLWGSLFRPVFDGNRHYKHAPLRDVVIVRNKVAPVSSGEGSISPMR